MLLHASQAHDYIINAIDGCGGLNIGGGAPELVTGSRDGTVRVWDPRQDTPVAALEPEEGSGRDCWSVAFGHAHTDEERCVAAGEHGTGPPASRASFCCGCSVFG